MGKKIARLTGFGAVKPQPTADLSNGADADTLLWNQEGAILDTTELICELMKEAGVSRSQLAHRLGKSKGYVTQLLDGSRNMTIRTVSDVLTNLGQEFRASCKAREPKQAMVVRIAAELSIPISQHVPQTNPFVSTLSTIETLMQNHPADQSVIADLRGSAV